MNSLLLVINYGDYLLFQYKTKQQMRRKTFIIRKELMSQNS